jgi:hypothetical protein
MAQGDLKKLIEGIQKDFLKTTTEALRKVKDKHRHVLSISKQSLIYEIRLQLMDVRAAKAEKTDNKSGFLGQPLKRASGIKTGNSRIQAQQALRGIVGNNRTLDNGTQVISDAEGLAIVKMVDDIFDSIIKTLKDAKRIPGKRSPYRKLTRNVSVRYRVIDSTILATFVGANNADVFDTIKATILAPAKLKIKNTLLSKFLSGDELKNTQERFLQLGHITAVSDFRVAKQLNAVNALANNMDSVSKVAADTLRTSISSKFSQYGGTSVRKEFLVKIVKTTFEAEATNLTDSDYEAANVESFKKALEETLKKLTKEDMGMQKGSDSVAEASIKLLINSALKASGQKTTIAVNRTPASSTVVSKVPKRPAPKAPTSGVLQLGPMNLPKQAAPSAINMQNLIPMLNQKLPELVKQNMGQEGRLRNRTGRFAESVEVLSISGDGMNIGFTYQTDPYAVFENQGARDPRSLIDLSIRQAAAGIMRTRFSTGRVR